MLESEKYSDVHRFNASRTKELISLVLTVLAMLLIVPRAQAAPSAFATVPDLVAVAQELTAVLAAPASVLGQRPERPDDVLPTIYAQQLYSRVHQAI